MAKLNLIKCSTCRNKYKKVKTLGEVLEDGNISVQRVVGAYYRDFTMVGGKDFWIKCGFCGQIAYSKHDDDITIKFDTGYLGTVGVS